MTRTMQSLIPLEYKIQIKHDKVINVLKLYAVKKQRYFILPLIETL